MSKAKERLLELNTILADNISAKGVDASKNETTTSLVHKVEQIKTAKEEQEKTIEITENGVTEILPNDNRVLSKVTVDVDVPSDDNLLRNLIDGSITEINVPYGVTKLKSYAFSYCLNLSKINLPDTVTLLDNYCFQRTAIKEFIMSDNVTSANYGVFYQCTSLEKVVLGNNLVANLDGMFYGCTNLSDVTLGNKIVVIQKQSFEKCKSLQTIVIPNSVKTIYANPFYESGLVTITLPQSITTLNKDALRGTYELVNLTVECEIKDNFNLSNCSKLTVESAKSALIALKNYAGTEYESIYSITFHSDVWDRLDAEGETSPDGTTWKAYTDNKGWNY